MTTSWSRSSFFKTLIPVFAIVLVVIGALFLIKSQVRPADQTTLQIGEILPDFSVKQIGKGTVQRSELKAKVLMVTFWATWCDACITEMPTIIQLWERYKDRGFQVMAINADEEPEVAAPPMAKRLGMPFPIYVDPEGKVVELLDVHAVPFTILLDQAGRILFIENGERDWNSSEIHSTMERWLSNDQ